MALTATSTSGPTTTSCTPRRASSSSTPSRRTGRGTRCGNRTPATASPPTSRPSTPPTPPPALTLDNPAGPATILGALRFWLDMGIDGFRLDAVPYLYEPPGTNGENLRETHDSLKQVGRHVDEHSHTR